MSEEELNVYINDEQKLIIVEMNMWATTKAGELRLVTQHLELNSEATNALIEILQKGLSTISETEEL